MVSGNAYRAAVGVRLYWATQMILAMILGLQALLYLISPFRAVPPTRSVWMAMAVFLAVFAAASRLALGHGAKDDPLPHATEWMNRLASERLFRRLAAISTVGLCLHVYSKYYLTRLRPISCLSEIRFAWLEVSHALLPWYVRTASVLGHLLCSFLYFGLFATSLAAVRSCGHAQAMRRFLLYLLVFMGMGTLYAGFIGSRNVMLAYFIMALSGILLGLCTAQQDWKRSLGVAVRTILLPFLIAAGFSTVVFLNRIYCGVSSVPADAYVYLQDNCNALSCTQSDPGLRVWSQRLSALCPPCAPTMLYVNHGVINFAQIWATEKRGTPVLFEFFRTIPQRLGFDSVHSSPSSRVYGPGGTTLAGGAYHDYGIAGMLLTAALLGIMYGLAMRLITAGGNMAWAGIWLFIVGFYVMAISSIFVGSNVIPFPFIAFASAIILAALALYSMR